MCLPRISVHELGIAKAAIELVLVAVGFHVSLNRNIGQTCYVQVYESESNDIKFSYY